MERSAILAAMSELKLYGMKAVFDEIIATAVKRQYEPQRIIGDLLAAEISEKQARSIRYQITISKLPLAKDIADFVFIPRLFGQNPCAQSRLPTDRTSSGSSANRFHAQQQWSMMSSQQSKIRFESQLSRMYCQTFS